MKKTIKDEVVSLAEAMSPKGWECYLPWREVSPGVGFAYLHGASDERFAMVELGIPIARDWWIYKMAVAHLIPPPRLP